MNRFIKFDYNSFYTILTITLSGLFSLLFFLKTDIYLIYFIIGIIVLISIISSIYFYFFAGLHFNYQKEIILIHDGFFSQKIKMREIKYVEFFEIKKKKKRRLFTTIAEYGRTRFSLNEEPTYIYNNGKVFKIVFNLQDGRSIDFTYSVLFNERNTLVVKFHEEKIKTCIKEFDNYKYQNYFKNNK